MHKSAAVILATLAMAVRCYSQTARPPTIKGHTLGETMQQFVTKSNAATREQIVKCGSLRQSQPGYGECEAFIETANKEGNGSFECQDQLYGLGMCRDFRGTVTFASNKLTEVNLEITDKEWEEALSDAVAKFGKPNESHTETVQNSYGANWELQRASWINSDYVVNAFEKINTPYNLNRFVEITLTDRKYFEAQHKKPAGNSLDR